MLLPMTEPDGLDRAAKLSARIADAEKRLTEMRGQRDDLIREFRAAGMSIPKIAAAAGVSESTVKAVLR